MFHWSVNHWFGLLLMCWEVRPFASEEPAASYLLKNLSQKHLICMFLNDRSDEPGTRKFIGPPRRMAQVAEFAEKHKGQKPV